MVVDFHSHMLPRIDDGSGSVEESRSLLRMSAEQGIGEVVLTPHFYPHLTTPEVFLEKRRRSMELLQQSIEHETGLPALRLGAEVHYFPYISQSDALEKLAIERTRAILVEMPMREWTDTMYRELENIYDNLGLIPIVAHVDRYLGRFRDYGIPERLSELPVMVQANGAAFLESSWGMKLLLRRQIHLLGSDSHNLKDRKPNLGPALERITRKLGLDAVEWIRSNEREILG